MAGKPTPMLLVTANVGSIFEDPTVMLKIWIEEFLSTVSRLDPKFIALHCQEVGGKNYERSMKHVEYFVRLLMSSEELRLFDRVRVYLDEDYSSAEHFTALGNFYFIHESLTDILMWDFQALSFVAVNGKDIHSGNIEAVSTKEKSKFPQDFFPECKWSRKGFLRTRWNINGTVIDLINIHLFHDASNFIAMESFPSVYCKTRRRALEHTLDRFHNDDNGNAPFFVFGDFNFRIDTQGVVKKLAEGLNPVRMQSNKNAELTKLQYRDSTSQVVLSLGKKEFSHQEHEKVFIEDNAQWLKAFDKELEPFSGRLFEFGINFPPSYPFEENEKGAKRYMQTRCPSWCDRVVLSYTAKSLISDPSGIEYGLMGINTCMGDHKPVFLKLDLIANAGMISCCTFRDADCESPPCFGQTVSPFDHATRKSSFWSCKRSSFCNQRANTSLIIEPSPSTHFLALPQSALLHEPYTPESVDSPPSSPVSLYAEQNFDSIGIRRLENEPFEHEDIVKRINENLICDQVVSDFQAKSNCCENNSNSIVSTNTNVPEKLQIYSHIDKQQLVQDVAQILNSDYSVAHKSSHVKSVGCTSEGNIPDLYSVLERTSTDCTECLVQRCRCFSDSSARKGAHPTPVNFKPKIRIRLISCSSSHSARLQSHHSSSDEDWFEQVDSDDQDTNHSAENIVGVDCYNVPETQEVFRETDDIQCTDVENKGSQNKNFNRGKLTESFLFHPSRNQIDLSSSTTDFNKIGVQTEDMIVSDSVISVEEEPVTQTKDIDVRKTLTAQNYLLEGNMPCDSLSVGDCRNMKSVFEPGEDVGVQEIRLLSQECANESSNRLRHSNEKKNRKQSQCCSLL